MDPNIQAILNRGYMSSTSLLDPLLLRPYKNINGIPVIDVRTGVKKNSAGEIILNNGMPEFSYRQQRVYTNALLRKADWERIDAEVMDVMRVPLVGISDLLSAGLTNPLGDIGVSISTYEQLSDMSPADVSMSVTPRKGENDRQEFTPISIPVPIISKPFNIDIRTLSASRLNGHQGLDVTQARTATVKVRESLETILFQGSDLTVESFAIYGYKNHPKRDTATAAQYGGGDFGTDTNGHKTLVGIMTTLKNQGVTGPFGVYVSSTQYAQLLELTGTNKTETQLSVILRTIPELKFVKSTDKLDSSVGETIMVSLTKETVDLAIGMDVTPVSWSEYGGLVNEFRVMTAAVPRIKFDANDVCGVAHATGC